MTEMLETRMAEAETAAFPPGGFAAALRIDSRIAGSAGVQSRSAVAPLPPAELAGEPELRALRGIQCLSAACLTLTPAGEKPLAALAAGDLVLTRDQGFRPLIWVGEKTVSPGDLQEIPELAPVLIAKGALGGHLPDRDMLVSPRHRVLICGPQSLELFGEHEVLVPAIHLVGLPGIGRYRPAQGLDYVQLVFAEHQVIRCDGTWCESFQPTPMAIAGLDPVPRARLLARLPQTLAEAACALARRSLRREESRQIFAIS